MIYRDFKDLKLSMLGFGTMRLPLKEDLSIDEELVAEMTDYALRHGINYIDTAWPYMNNRSEAVMGRVLQKYPRDSYYLATKYPGHMIAETYDPADIFEIPAQIILFRIFQKMAEIEMICMHHRIHCHKTRHPKIPV